MAFRFRPTLWPTLLTIPALLTLVALGNWQMERFAWKRELLATLEAQLGQPSVILPASIAAPEAWEFRRVRVEGVFLHAKEMHLSGRARRGVPGVEVVTPLRRADGSVILVNRGWVPLAEQDPAARPDGYLVGGQTVEGVLRTEKPKGWLTPPNEPANGLWFRLSLAEMGKWVDEGPVLPVFLEASPSGVPGRYPAGKAPEVDLPENHLGYAITWYALAVALVLIYLIYHGRPRA